MCIADMTSQLAEAWSGLTSDDLLTTEQMKPFHEQRQAAEYVQFTAGRMHGQQDLCYGSRSHANGLLPWTSCALLL